MPSDSRQLRSFGSTWREISAISALPVSMTTLGPMSIWTPRPIGPLLRKRPFEIVLTVPVTVSGRLSPGICRHRHLAADRERHLGADPGRDRLLHGFGVVDREGRDILEPLAQDRGEHGGRVHRAARGAVVVMVEQDDRPLAGLRRLQRLGARQRLFERLELVDEILAVGPGPVEQFVAQSFGERAGRRRSRRPPTARHCAMSACGKPVNRLAASAPSLSIAAQRACNSLFGWSSEPCRMTCGSIGTLPQAITGLHLAAHRPQQDLAGALGGVVGVDMRVGAVAGDDRRVVDDRVVEVGVHVERHGDRRRRDRSRGCGAGVRPRRPRGSRSPSRRAGRA